jgi:hypothetical protein
MSTPHFDAFLAQCVHEDPDNETGLSADEIYGLYISWCLLNQEPPHTSEILMAALRYRRIAPGNNQLVMKGPAATDYIVASAPAIV